MRHAKANQLLSAYLERDLGETERAGVEAHLAGCVACRADLGDLRAAVVLLHQLPTPEAPPFLAGRVMARIRDGEARPAGWREWLPKLAAPAVAAVLAAVVAGASVVYLAEPAGEAQRSDLVASKTPDPGPRPALRYRPALQFQPTGPVAPEARVLARLLRGAGHPHSNSLAAHFEGPAEAVFVSWQPE